MRFKLFRIAAYIFLALLLSQVALVIAKIGSTRILRTWNSTPGALGVDRPLKVELERHVAYIDVLGGYPSYRLRVTDGGYGYFHDFGPNTDDVKSFVEGCQVTWSATSVAFITPEGVTTTFPAKVVIQQIGQEGGS